MSPACWIALLSMASLGSVDAGQTVKMSLQPEVIEANTFFDGATVEVTAEVPSGYQVALVCTGKEEKLELKKKGKVMSLLWMNTGEISFDHLPSIYLLETSANLSDFGTSREREDFGLGYTALETKAIGQPPDPERSRLFKELVKLQEKRGRFSVNQNSIELKNRSAAGPMTGRLRLPANTPPGDYQMRLIGLSPSNKLELMDSRKLSLKQVGLTALVSSVSHRHGLLYGVAAVIIALVVGLLTGLLFGLGSKGGH